MADVPSRFLRRRIFPAPGTRSSRGLGAVGTLTRAASLSRVDAFDKRAVAGRLVYDAREAFTAHAGGPDEVSVTETALIERLAMRKLLLALGDEILRRTQAEGGTPRDVMEVGQKLAALDAGYVQMLKELGWRPKEKPVPTLQEYLAQKAAAKQQGGGGGGGDGSDSSS